MSAEPAELSRAPPGPDTPAMLAPLLAGFRLAFGDGSTLALHAAQDAFARALLMDSERPEPYLGQGYCHANLGDPDRALAMFDLAAARGFGAGALQRFALEIDADDKPQDGHDAGEGEGEGDGCGAAGGWIWHFEVDADTVRVWRAAAQLERGAVEAAAAELAAVSPQPQDTLRATVAVLRGRVHLAGGAPSAAQRQLGQALAWDRDDPDAHALRARLHERQGRVAAALRAWGRAIRLAPDDPEFRLARAALCLARREVPGGALPAIRADLDAAAQALQGWSPAARWHAELDRLRTALEDPMASATPLAPDAADAAGKRRRREGSAFSPPPAPPRAS